MEPSIVTPFIITTLICLILVGPSAYTAFSHPEEHNSRKLLKILIFFASSLLATFVIYMIYDFKFERFYSLIPFDVKNENYSYLQNQINWLWAIPSAIGILHFTCLLLIKIKRQEN